MRRQPNRNLRTVIAALASVLAVGIVPLMLIAASVKRFGRPSPLDGMKAPWHWTADDVRSWIHTLNHGLDSSAELTDLFMRVALVSAWVCSIVLVASLIDEIVYQLRTGIPCRLLPTRQLGCGSPITCWRRLRDWQRAGVWQQLHHQLLTKLSRQGQLEWSRASLDSISVRAKRGPS